LYGILWTRVVFIVRYIMDTSGIYCTVYYQHEWYLLYGILWTRFFIFPD
jgi:hypothetical protein